MSFESVPRSRAEVELKEAEEQQIDLANFTAWFVKNYPGPGTIIHDPLWHAPRIYRAAMFSAQLRERSERLEVPQPDPAASPSVQPETAPEPCQHWTVDEKYKCIACGKVVGKGASVAGDFARNPTDAEPDRRDACLARLLVAAGIATEISALASVRLMNEETLRQVFEAEDILFAATRFEREVRSTRSGHGAPNE